MLRLTLNTLVLKSWPIFLFAIKYNLKTTLPFLTSFSLNSYIWILSYNLLQLFYNQNNVNLRRKTNYFQMLMAVAIGPILMLKTLQLKCDRDNK